MEFTIAAMTMLRGLWRRSVIVRPSGESDTKTAVTWLQGLRACVDLRQPATLRSFAHARSLTELSFDDCASLATQEGFAGHLHFDGDFFEWSRAIDFQPEAGDPDAGSLWFQGEVLVEKGRDIAYVEHWHRDTSVPREPVCAYALRERDSNTRAALVRVGPAFMYARDRAVLPAPHRSLAECVADAATLNAAQELIDCEISLGEVRGDRFQIVASTLPFRVGDDLAVHAVRDTASIRDRDARGNYVVRHWEITASEGEMNGTGAK